MQIFICKNKLIYLINKKKKKIIYKYQKIIFFFIENKANNKIK